MTKRNPPKRNTRGKDLKSEGKKNDEKLPDRRHVKGKQKKGPAGKKNHQRWKRTKRGSNSTREKEGRSKRGGEGLTRGGAKGTNKQIQHRHSDNINGDLKGSGRRWGVQCKSPKTRSSSRKKKKKKKVPKSREKGTDLRKREQQK